MTAQQIQIASTEALSFMANKAGCTVDAIAAKVMADPEGNTAKYFASLVGSAMVAMGA